MAELTNEYIDSLMEKAEKHISIIPSRQAMTITAIFPCGWVISSTANVVSGQKFVEEELRDKCLDDIKSEVWKLESYRKTVDNYKETLRQEVNEDEIYAGYPARSGCLPRKQRMSALPPAHRLRRSICGQHARRGVYGAGLPGQNQ